MDIKIKAPKRPHPTGEDFVRAFGYMVLMLWSVLFLVFPPISLASATDGYTRLIWMAITFIAAGFAASGSIFRIDFKMELPGLLFSLGGPLFYSLTQIFYILNPNELTGPPSQRYHLVIFALLPALFLLPRAYSLIHEANRLKRINRERTKALGELFADEIQETAVPKHRGKK